MPCGTATANASDHTTCSPPPPAISPPAAGVAVVTGGLRGLGARVARWLLDQGRARCVVLGQP